MNTIIEFSIGLFDKFGGIIFIPIILFAIVGIGSQFMLYEKCQQPGSACLVPVLNVIVFLRIVGRPAQHAWFIIVPPVLAVAVSIFGGYDIISYSALGIIGACWLGFIGKVYIELCNSFGKNQIIDYILIMLFNGLYVLNLGLSYEAKYRGPVYIKPRRKKNRRA